MINCYTSKKMVWVKVAFILIEYGGEEMELSKSTIVDRLASLFPKQSLCSNALTARTKPQVKQGIFEFVHYTTKIKGIKLIDRSILLNHSRVMETWRQKIK